MKNIRNQIIFYILFIFYKIFSFTPWKLNIFLGWLLGRIFYIFDFRYKYLAFKNLKTIFPDYDYKKVMSIVKECYSNLGKNLFEFFLFRRIKYLLDEIVEFSINDYEVIKNLIKEKRGIVIFSAHFGNWEILGAALAIKNFPLAVIARDIYIKKLNLVVEKLRKRVGEIVIGRGEEKTIKKLLLALKKGYMIGVLVDQNIKNIKTSQIPFLGRVAPTPISFAELVIKYEIPSVIGLIYRLKNNKHKIVIIPIEESLYQDKIKFLEYINSQISNFIIKYPEQWVWMHNRWGFFD